ncbi:MAG: pyridoxal phosphate-dependent aminotransferase [Oscillospiraceae bacterium]|nr:pyridoxal phosphate-dependent aminotransferase [Oscillospiraceae bacterium]
MKPLSKIAASVPPSATLAVDSLAKQMKAEGKPVVGFGTGEPDFATPQNIVDAAIAAIHAGKTKYTPAAGIPELRRAAAERLRLDCGLDYKPSEIVVASGAKHSLFAALMCLLDAGDEAILPAPYWLTYAEAVRFSGAVPVVVYADEPSDFKVTAAQIDAAVTERTKLLIINNPSNPTGMLYDRDELRAIADVAVRHDLYVVADEIYYKLLYDGRVFTSIASLGDDVRERTIIINGVSKSYAMTGWRVGYSASNAALATVMANYLSHSTSAPSTISQWAAVEALAGDQSTIEDMRKIFEQRRDYVVQHVNAIQGLSCPTPHGAFYVMINVASAFGKRCGDRVIANADDFALALLESQYVALVSCESFGCPNYVRISYAASMDDIATGIDRIARFMEELHG